MARLATIALAWLTFFSAIPFTSAWTLLWRNDTVKSRILTGTGAQNCTQIWHEEGYEFSFDPEGPWCLKFWGEPACINDIGITCEGYIWRQVATQNISAFNVYAMPPSSKSVYGFANPSTTTTAISSSTTTHTPSPTATSPTPTTSPSTASLTGGVIGGIVVGVVVAVVLLCGLFYYLGYRLGRAAGAAEAATTAAAAATAAAAVASEAVKMKEPPQPPSSPPASPPSSTSRSAYTPLLAEYSSEPPEQETRLYEPPFSRPPMGFRMVELPGQGGEAELSNSRQVQELEARGFLKQDGYWI